jgi:hypothetical protein
MLDYPEQVVKDKHSSSFSGASKMEENMFDNTQAQGLEMGTSELERVPEENRAKEEQIQQSETQQLKTEVEPNGDNSKKDYPEKSSDPACSDKLSQSQSNEIQGIFYIIL